MKYLWRLIIRAYLSVPLHKRVIWGEKDRTEFNLFLQSSCGKRFAQKLRESAADITFGAVYVPHDQAVSASAYARGWQDALALVYRLAHVFPSAEESEYGVEGEQHSSPPPGVGATQSRWLGQIGGGNAL